MDSTSAAAEGRIVEPTANGEQQFDPSRSFEVIGIIKRKALIKELAAAYHAECVACCKELLQLQRNWEEAEQCVEAKMPKEPKALLVKPSKRRKK